VSELALSLRSRVAAHRNRLLVEVRPLFNFDPANELRSAFAVRLEYQRFTIGNARYVGKGSQDIRHMRDEQSICSLWRLGHFLFEPCGLSLLYRLHALTGITEFNDWIRIAKLTKSHRLPCTIGWAREHIADRDFKISKRFAHGDCRCPTGFIELALNLKSGTV
jgi:hypothetical protein